VNASSNVGIRGQLKEIWAYRELLGGLVRKELKVKYKNSVLGFMWTLLNPALYLVVFWLAFDVLLDSRVPQFFVFFLSGYLVWTLFSNSIALGTGSVLANSSLVKKLYFPREVLPLAQVGAAIVHFFLQCIVLLVTLVIVWHDVSFRFMLLLPPALLIAVAMATGITLVTSSLNVRLRDTEHFVELGLLAWFWLTPIVYPFGTIYSERISPLFRWGFERNPITAVIITFQRAIHNVVYFCESTGEVDITNCPDVKQVLPNEPMTWYIIQLGLAGVVSLLVLYGGLRYFRRTSGDFAEEI
jgi:ABC-2 type transport system permease protein